MPARKSSSMDCRWDCLEDNMDDHMELKDLVGKHKLSGVDMLNESIKGTWGEHYDDCQVVRFILDGVTYSAIENPEDGYRSSMDEIRVDNGVVSNTFPEQEVLCVHVTKGEYRGEDDILEFRNVNTGSVIMRIGTANVDNWYPGFVCDWNPEEIDINKDK